MQSLESSLSTLAFSRKLIRNLLRLYYEVLGEDPAHFQLLSGFFLVGRLLFVRLAFEVGIWMERNANIIGYSFIART